MSAADDALKPFSPATQRWFKQTFSTPTAPQALGWPQIAAKNHTLICAPTGSGKTLAAFLFCIDEIVRELQQNRLPQGVHTLYVSPLKALNYDMERNLRLPLQGIRETATSLGLASPEVAVAVRTGDTSAAQRAAMLRKPPAMLITTPESQLL